MVTGFRERQVPAASWPTYTGSDAEAIPYVIPPLPVRAWRFLRRLASDPESREFDYWRVALLNNLPPLRDAVWGLRRAINRRHYHVGRIEDLPKRYVFYPLQYSPESSINVPAPYFVDQMRAIDALRFALPPDHVLVVKEHPSCILLRPGSFVRQLMRTAGVVVARYDLNTRAIIERAAATVSVTGTATLEAFLLGRPSLTLGGTFFARFLGGVCPLHDIRTRLAAAMATPPSLEQVVDAVATIRSVQRTFILRSAGEPGEPVMRRGNVRNFLAALLDHIELVRPYRNPAGTAP